MMFFLLKTPNYGLDPTLSWQCQKSQNSSSVLGVQFYGFTRYGVTNDRWIFEIQVFQQKTLEHERDQRLSRLVFLVFDQNNSKQHT